MNLRQGVIGLVAAATLFACHTKPTAPWKLVALGTEPIDSALVRGEAVCAWNTLDTAWPVLLYASDAAVLNSLPDIHCGDQVVVSPTDLPKAFRQRMQWEGSDSLTSLGNALGDKSWP